MTIHPFQYAQAYVHMLTGSSDTVMHWRALHDSDKSAQPRVLTGTIAKCYPQLAALNNAGYGIFTPVNALDGQGYGTANVINIRAHMVDLDNPETSIEGYNATVQDGASFAVNTSPNKVHVYWRSAPYLNTQEYTIIQRKLARLYNGDPSVIDSARVMRVSGFNHMKGEPFLATCWQLSGATYSLEQMQAKYAHVDVFDHISSRSPLGTVEMQAPSYELLKQALYLIDPNQLDRSEWLSISAAYKQAGWNLADEDTLRTDWLKWCAAYAKDDEGEDIKLWNSVRDTEVGWSTFYARTSIRAYAKFGQVPPSMVQKENPVTDTGFEQVLASTGHREKSASAFGEILSPQECQEYFKGCYWIDRMGEIFTPTGRFMNSTQFNGTYGGKQFIITENGKVTDEAWKAALRSTVYNIPKVDHVRFLPEHAFGEVLIDGMGRRGLNTYIPARIDVREGDISRWMEWLTRLLPVESDRAIVIEYLAHCVKYPGHKIPWALMIQSTEGTGKTVFRELLSHALGDMYVYQPKAPELVKSGSVFNGWMRAKLMIVVDEIKIDERRELIEILKPMISEARIEIQSKGVDQEMEDNVANWLFFSNYKDAIPINQNGRRYAVFYSALQSAQDIARAGMGGNYFPELFKWLRREGYAAITHFLLNYHVDREIFPMRAPFTSSHDEALNVSRSPLEQLVAECVADEICGFRGGYISGLAVAARCKNMGMRVPTQQGIQRCLESMGYIHVGRSQRVFMQEDVLHRAEIFGVDRMMDVEGYARAQGYE